MDQPESLEIVASDGGAVRLRIGRRIEIPLEEGDQDDQGEPRVLRVENIDYETRVVTLAPVDLERCAACGVYRVPGAGPHACGPRR